MSKRRNISITLIIIGFCVLALAIFCFFHSFHVKRDIQAYFGFTAIGLVFCSFLLISIGIIRKKQRTKRQIVGCLLCLLGIMFTLFASVLFVFALLAVLLGGSFWGIWLSLGLNITGITSIVIGLLLYTNDGKGGLK